MTEVGADAQEAGLRIDLCVLVEVGVAMPMMMVWRDVV